MLLLPDRVAEVLSQAARDAGDVLVFCHRWLGWEPHAGQQRWLAAPVRSTAAEELLCRYGAPRRQSNEPGSAWLRRALPAIGVRRILHPGNHRYLFMIGPRASRRRLKIDLPRLPYPKVIDTPMHSGDRSQ